MGSHRCAECRHLVLDDSSASSVDGCSTIGEIGAALVHRLDDEIVVWAG